MVRGSRCKLGSIPGQVPSSACDQRVEVSAGRQRQGSAVFGGEEDSLGELWLDACTCPGSTEMRQKMLRRSAESELQEAQE
jgi:hypothetical protein